MAEIINLTELDIKTAGEGIASGRFSARDLTEAYLTKIKAVNPKLNAYLEVFDDALEQAEEVDRKIKAGELAGPLAGIPLAIKDNILISGRTVSAASKMLANYQATYNATVIEKLKALGVIFLGRTNMDEFAMGGSTENSAYGPTKNPRDLTRVAGGSSGGSAATVAGDLALVALGTDTGGSIRQPASYCGVVGLKPTYGAVSRYGVIALASSFDQVGPIAKTVADVETVFKAIRGQDKFDSISQNNPMEIKVPAKFKIGVPEAFLQEGVDPEVMANFRQTIDKLKMSGHEIITVDLPNFHYALACYYILMTAEASSNLARFDGVRYGLHQDGKDVIEDYFLSRGAGFGPEVKRRIMLGTYVLSSGYYDAYYRRANNLRQLIRADYLNTFKQVDVIITPTAPTVAFKIGENTADPLKMYLEDIFTVPANLAGVPALSVPTGKNATGLPFGLQISAPHFGEDLLFALGRELEA
ncbi:MAG: Asp-tRNA(Asn)/Glu-tRNA(Gln) amidotransferase subunit GatA [Patescibacteria group bacterium]